MGRFGRLDAIGHDSNAAARRPARRAQIVLRFLVCLAVLSLSASLPGAVIQPVGAQAAACTTSGPESGAYAVRLCLTAPGDGATLTGDATVSATLSAEWGLLPRLDYVQFYFTPAGHDHSTTVLQDVAEPFTFTLPTRRFADRTYRLEVGAVFKDGFATAQSAMQVTTANGITRIPIGTGRWEPTSVEGEGPVVVAAVGDGAGGLPGATQVSTMLAGWNPDMLLYLGDVYNTGSYTEYLNYYAPTFGRLKNITNPVPGDHEGGKQFQGYRDYWNSNQSYYSVTAGDWRLIALDSTKRFGQTTPGTAQFEWLRAELAADDDAGCTLVYFHDPRWGLDQHTDYTKLDAVWRLLSAEGVDVVLDGNEHNYQRWQPLDADGKPDPAGITEFVVGTGGHEQMKLGGIDARVAAAYQTDGALRLELSPQEASFTYLDTAGAVLDAGTIGCDGRGPIPAAPTTPAGDTTATIVNTGGIGVRCRVSPDLNAEIITVVPEGTQVSLRGAPAADWQPVRCAGRDGYIFRQYIAPGG
jgi:hypothetical protein